MRSTLLASLLLVTTVFGGPEESKVDEDVVRLLAARSDLIVSVEVKDDPEQFGINLGYAHYRCKFQCLEILVGKKPSSEVIAVWFNRGRMEQPSYRKGEKFILFLRGAGTDWRLVADYAGIQPYSVGLQKIVAGLKK